MPGTYRTAHDTRSLRDTVRLNAARQGRVFRREDLRAWGLDATVVQAMVRKGHWRKMRYGVYVDTDDLRSSEGDASSMHALECAAAIKAMRLPAYVFGPSAALFHQLPVQNGLVHQPHLVRYPYRDIRVLNRSPNRPPSLPDVSVVSHELHPAQLTVWEGIPIVRRPLAAVSAACHARPDWAVGLLDAVLWDGSATRESLYEIIGEWPLLRGIGTVRRAAEVARPGAQTILETLSRVRLMRAGLEEPALQREFHDEDGLIGYADMFWESLGVIGEADGEMKYATRADIFNEKRREDRLRALGYIVVRWTWHEIMTDPRTVARRILAASQISRRRAG
ncbi:MAG: DUF559 domain-containing protein [Actinobacteria bacterium]|uniref:Unannotated protein n=1 Tax=freshwater metagenome TaxID=449393 RepID=A0A6J7LLC1_9ZZZZ|nr:DUF559 domain-containing protein [Actinomycetota bacterium]